MHKENLNDDDCDGDDDDGKDHKNYVDDQIQDEDQDKNVEDE